MLDRYEHNGYLDSDFYAVAWDDENQCVTSRQMRHRSVLAYHNGASVDATPEATTEG